MRASGIILLLGSLVLAKPQQATAQGQAPVQRVEATAADLLNLSDQLKEQGRSDDAEQILSLLANDPDPDIRSEARYRRALLLESKGRNQTAAVLLRQLLDEKPAASAPRIELAMLLQKLGDEGSALRELRALRTTDLPPNVARFVDRLSASLQATKPFGMQFEFALAPDSNINRATRSDTLGTVLGDFTLDQKRRSGTGAAVRGFAQGRLPISGNLSLVSRFSSDASLYRDTDFNDISLELAAGPELQVGKTRLGIEAGAGQQWYGMKPYQRSLRLSGSATRPMGPVSQLRLDVGARWTDNRFNSLQDGHGLSLRARYERALSPTLLVAATAGIDRFKARDDAYSTRSWGTGISAYKDIGRLTLSAGVEIGRLEADDRLVLLPETREDRLTRLSIGTVFRQFTVAGFAPVTRFVVERNKSSVEFYDYKRTRTEFGISRAF